jgi:hypothetical protein
MKTFILDVDFTMSKRIQVEAENEEQARMVFKRLVGDNPYNFAKDFDAYVYHDIIDVEEE